MSHYRKIDVRIWNDAKFRALSDDGKLVFLYVLTHPSMTSLGAMRASVDGLAHELKWLPERFRKGLAEPLSKGMIEVDEAADLVALPNFLRYNPADNGNVVKAWASCLDMLPECDLKSATIQRAWLSLQDRPQSLADAFKEAFNGIPNGMANRSANGMANRMPNQEQEQEHEQEQEPTLRAYEHSEGTYTHAREAQGNTTANLSSASFASDEETGEVPFDPPDTLDEAKAWVRRQGVHPEHETRACTLLMSWQLTGSLLDGMKRDAA